MTLGQAVLSYNQNTGSPSFGEPVFLAVGKLRRPHGVRGEMIMSVWTDYPERLLPGVKIYVGDTHETLTIKSVRWHRQDILIAFDEYADRDQVGVFRNHLAYVRTDDIPSLPDGEFYLYQLVGLRVIRDDDDVLLGTIEEIIETGANEVLVVRTEDGGELLLPDIPSVVLHIDVQQGEMRVHLLPGLMPAD
ncbi:MAG: ribosome maturation factor RimM [Chloroflexota bacterium]|nr:ribosome maturation factor RimM [Chloroflexota bacterium]